MSDSIRSFSEVIQAMDQNQLDMRELITQWQKLVDSVPSDVAFTFYNTLVLTVPNIAKIISAYGNPQVIPTPFVLNSIVKRDSSGNSFGAGNNALAYADINPSTGIPYTDRNYSYQSPFGFNLYGPSPDGISGGDVIGGVVSDGTKTSLVQDKNYWRFYRLWATLSAHHDLVTYISWDGTHTILTMRFNVNHSERITMLDFSLCGNLANAEGEVLPGYVPTRKVWGKYGTDSAAHYTMLTFPDTDAYDQYALGYWTLQLALTTITEN